ncbi:hypothetical protein FQJ01_23135 [Escherichia coli]|nr:hypothetical protein [Escherichia coli]
MSQCDFCGVLIFMTWITNRFFSWCEIGIKTMILLLLLMDTGWICPYISRHLLSLNPLLACCRRYSRGER